MANYPRTEDGFNAALNAVFGHTGMHDSKIYIYVPPAGDEYIVSIIHPGEDIAENTGVGTYDKTSFSDEDREIRNQWTMMQDAPDQTAAMAG